MATAPGAHRHKNLKGAWVTGNADGDHTHDATDLDTMLKAAGMSLAALAAAIAQGGGGGVTPPPPPPDPVPPPDPPGPVRTFPGGTQAAPSSATVANETWQLAPTTVLTGVIHNQAPGLIVDGGGGGTVRTIYQEANGLKLRNGLKFTGGSESLVVMGRDGLVITDGVDFRGVHETPIRFRIGPGGILAGDVLIEDSFFLHNGSPDNGKGYSTMSNERPPGDPEFGPKLGPMEIRRNHIDQGVYGWGGIEIWDTDLWVHDNWMKGRAGAGAGINAHMSIPRCFGARVEYNEFDMRQGAYWGIEAVELNDLVYEHNRIIGAPPNGYAAVQLHGGSAGKMYRASIQYNWASDMPVFVNQYGWDHVIAHNKLVNVTTVYKPWGNPGTTPAMSDNTPTTTVTAGPR